MIARFVVYLINIVAFTSHSLIVFFTFAHSAHLRERVFIQHRLLVFKLLRPRSQYEYVTSSHLIVALNQASLLDSLSNSSVNRIFQFIDHAQIFSERAEKWTRDLKRKFYWTIHEEIHFMIFTSWSENDIKTTNKRIEIDIETLYLVNRKIQINLDVS
jgi:hypothetical protein